VKYVTEHEWNHPVIIAGETQKPRTIEMLKRIATLKDPDGFWKEKDFREALKKRKKLSQRLQLWLLKIFCQ